jgi:hypothetical protein
LTKPDENGSHSPGDSASLRLELVMDLATFQVSIGGEQMPISLAQMICGEALRLLDEQRRLAAATQLGQRIQDAARTKELLDRVAGRRQ